MSLKQNCILALSLGLIWVSPSICQTTYPPTVVVVHPPAIVTASSQASIQAAIDVLANSGGGTLVLDPGATYYVDSISLPWTADTKYSHIRIVGNRTRLRAISVNSPGDAVLRLGAGWQAHEGPKLKNNEFHGLIIEQLKDCPTAKKAAFWDACDGTLFSDCEFINPSYEALYQGGGTSCKNGRVVRCVARDSGHGGPAYNAGPLAGFNINGYSTHLEYCTAINCGWGFEVAGTSARISHCRFFKSQNTVGSSSFGVSDVEFSRCVFEDSSSGFANGIGKLADIRFLDCTMIRSPVGWSGAKATNNVTLPGLPFYDRPNLIMGCRFVGLGDLSAVGQGLRIVNWYPEYDRGTTRVIGCDFSECNNDPIICQSYLVEGFFEFRDNYFANQKVGTAYLYRPDGVALPDPTPRLNWMRNRIPSGAYILRSDNVQISVQ